MRTKTYRLKARTPKAPPTEKAVAPTKTPEELLANFADQHRTTARRTIAMRRQFPDGVKWRRAATVGPNAEFVLIAVASPTTGSVDYHTATMAWLDGIAENVTPAEVDAELYRFIAAHNPEQEA